MESLWAQAWVIAVSAVISSQNVQNPLLFRCSCFIRFHLQKHSYHPVSLSLPRPFSLILLLSLPPSFSLFFFFYHRFFITLSIPSIFLHPSYSYSRLPVCSSSFWRLSHSSPSFNCGYFLHLSVLPSLSPALSLLLSVSSFPSLSAHPFVSLLRSICTNISLPHFSF